MYGNRFFAKNHPDSRAIFYEASTYSKRRINDLLKTLQGFELAQTIESIFKGNPQIFLSKKKLRSISSRLRIRDVKTFNAIPT